MEQCVCQVEGWKIWAGTVELEKTKMKTKIEVKKNWRVSDRFLLDCEYKVLDISRRVLLFLATTDSGDVSSTSEADTLELLSDFRVFCSSYSRKKRRLTIVFCLSEYFGRVFANIEHIKPTHI